VSKTNIYLKYFALLLLLMPFIRVEPAPVDYLIWLGGAVLFLKRPKVYWDKLPRYFRMGLVIFAIAHVSFIWAPDLGRAVFFILATAEMFVIFILFQYAGDSEDDIKSLFDYYILGSSVAAFIGILAYYDAIPFSDIFMYANIRAMGFFQGPNVFGAHLVPAVILTWHQYIQDKNTKVKKALYLMAGFILAGGIILSGSRTAWGGTVLGLSLFGAYLVWKNGVRKTITNSNFLPVMVTASLFLILVPPTGSMLSKRAALLQHYDYKRFEKQRQAITSQNGGGQKGGKEGEKDGQEGSPLLKIAKFSFGRGPGQSEINLSYATHNIYLRVYYELGIVGSLGFLMVIACSFVYLRHYFFPLNNLTAVFLSVLVTLMAMGLVIDTLHWRHLFVFSGLAFALIEDNTDVVEILGN